MAVPAGYTELGRIGFVDRGTYASGTTYRIGDVVYYNGSTWVALKDNLKGVTPVTGANWKYMARGFAAEALSAITAKDTSGVLGTAGASVTSQALVDAIADKVMTKLIEKSKIVNNLLATDTTTVLSGPMGKSLDEKIGGVISDLGALTTNLGTAVGLIASRVIKESDTIALADILSNYKYVIIRVTVSAYCRDTVYYAGGIGTPITINAGLQYNSTYYAYINLTFTDSGHIEVNLIDKSSAWAAHDVILQVIGFKA